MCTTPAAAGNITLLDDWTLSVTGEVAPNVRDAAALRSALRGKWLYLLGDSSTRGLALSLYQQLCDERSRADNSIQAGLMGFSWFGREKNLRYLGWLDAVLDANTGAILGVRSAKVEDGRIVKKCQRPDVCSYVPVRAPNKDGADSRDGVESLAWLWCLGEQFPGREYHRTQNHTREHINHTHGLEHEKRKATASNAPCGEVPPHSRCMPQRNSIRITFRYATFLSNLRKDPFSEFRRCWDLNDEGGGSRGGDGSGGGDNGGGTAHGARRWRSRPPDAHLLQIGNWDEATMPPREAFENEMFEGIRHWTQAGLAVSAALVFSTSPVAFRLAAAGARPTTTNCTAVSKTLPRACIRKEKIHHGLRESYLGGEYERELFHGGCGGAWSDAVRGVKLLNRVASGHLLREAAGHRCPCLGADYRERAWGGSSMRYHAPHLHNLFDVQRLVSLLRGGTSGKGNEGVQREPQVAHGPASEDGWVSITLMQPLREGCCCEAPTDGRWRAQDNSKGGLSFSNLSMWARLCEIRPDAK